MSALSLVAVVAAGSACGKKAESVPAKDDAKVVAPTVAPIAVPPIGIDAVKRMSFPWDAGKPAYEKAVAAYRAKTRDWAAVRAQAEAAIAKDPNHLDAHRLLGTALAKTGDPAAAVDHLVIALAADHGKYAPSIEKDEDLKDFLATPHGASVTEVSAKIKAEYGRRAATGVLVVARRSPFKLAGKYGPVSVSSRGELYAFDRETKRFLRLSHTEHQVAGFVRSASGAEILLLGFDKVEQPEPVGKGTHLPTMIVNAWLEVIDATTWARVGKRVSLGGGREVSVGYGPGEQVLVATAGWAADAGLEKPVVSSLDRTTGKLTKVGAALPVPRIAFNLDEGKLIRAADGVTAAWTGEPPKAPSIAAGGATITIPESGATAQSSVTLAPDKAHLAFATAVDPCAKNVAPSLYIADAKTGTFRHLLTTKSRFGTRWIDASTLAYEDGLGAIRLWDPKRDGRGAEVLRLENKPGIALDVLSFVEPEEMCKLDEARAPADGPSEPPDEIALPPEEPAGTAAN